MQLFFSALLNFSIEDIAEYRSNYIVSAEFNISNGVLYANGFYSGIALHSVPLAVNLLSNALIKSVAGDAYSIRTSSQQLPNSLSSTLLPAPETESFTRVLTFCCFFFCTIALFVIHPFQEMETKLKQLQRMTGVTSISYWCTMFTFDLIALTISIFIIILGFYIMDVILDIRLYYKIEIRKMISNASLLFFTSANNRTNATLIVYIFVLFSVTMILLLLLFGISSLFVTYLFSFINKSRNTIINMLTLIPIVVGNINLFIRYFIS